jgi:hypothetical protein
MLFTAAEFFFRYESIQASLHNIRNFCGYSENGITCTPSTSRLPLSSIPSAISTAQSLIFTTKILKA